MNSTLTLLIALLCCLVLTGNGMSPATAAEPPPAHGLLSVAAYPSIQAALDANPGQVVYVPAGDHEISEKIRIRHDNGGLCGPGRIIQTNAEDSILEIVRAVGVRIRDLTLTRAVGKTETLLEGVQAMQCRDLVLENLRVIDNHSSRSAIGLHGCDSAQVRGCLVRNYHRVSVEDRTKMPQYGFAFHCIAGCGIETEHGSGVLLQSNRIIEERLRPTQEVKEKHRLGQYVKKNPVKGTLMNQQVWDGGYAQNWHQGSGIVVNAGNDAEQIQILGNTVENAGQGMDIHADHVIISQNIVNNAHIGMKAMHGSRHVLITGNQFIRNDLWSIGLMPGTASYPARPASAGQAARADNSDGASIIANNIISEFGHGDAHWIWGDDGVPLRFGRGPETDSSPLSEVIIQGNIVYDSGHHRIADEGKPKPRPLYRYAVLVEGGDNGPKDLHFSNNILHAGMQGVSNVELKP